MTTTPERLTTALRRSYRIERELGAGGMATVYLAEDINIITPNCRRSGSIGLPAAT